MTAVQPVAAFNNVKLLARVLLAASQIVRDPEGNPTALWWEDREWQMEQEERDLLLDVYGGRFHGPHQGYGEHWTAPVSRSLLDHGRLVVRRTGDVVLRYGHREVHLGRVRKVKAHEWTADDAHGTWIAWSYGSRGVAAQALLEAARKEART